MIQDASRSRVQSARSMTIAGSATAVIISSRPGEEHAGAEHGEQEQPVAAREGVHRPRV